MKAALERIEPGFGTSFLYRKFESGITANVPMWHFHPEYEIVFISGGKGKRHIGNHLSFYEDGDLIFLGPNLPHLGFTEELPEKHVEIVVQMKEEFLGRDFLQIPEMFAIKQVFERAKLGLSFSGKIKQEVGKRLVAMGEMSAFDRLIHLVQILNQLAESEEYTILNADSFPVEVNAQDQERMQKIYEYVQFNFQGNIQLEVIAKEINMTIPAFCRYFKKLTQKTFIQFANEYRVAHACRLLAEDDLSIANASYESGFNNLSHFNKQFRAVTGLSPRDYRKNRKKLIKVDNNIASMEE